MKVCRLKSATTLPDIRDNDWRKGGKMFIGTGTLVYSFGLMKPVPVIHFHFSYKKHKDNFVFQIKRRIFASKNLLLI